jgi:hypothetical protein
MIRVCLTADPANFPGCIDDKRAIARSAPANRPDIRILGLAPGTYGSTPSPASSAKDSVSRAIRASGSVRRALRRRCSRSAA